VKQNQPFQQKTLVWLREVNRSFSLQLLFHETDAKQAKNFVQ
jgi:hypothetical protein